MRLPWFGRVVAALVTFLGAVGIGCALTNAVLDVADDWGCGCWDWNDVSLLALLLVMAILGAVLAVSWWSRTARELR